MNEICIMASSYYKRDPVRAAALYKKAVSGGDSDAMYSLACMYESGYGVPKNYDIAKKLFQGAAEKGNEEAMRELIHSKRYKMNPYDEKFIEKIKNDNGYSDNDLEWAVQMWFQGRRGTREWKNINYAFLEIGKRYREYLFKSGRDEINKYAVLQKLKDYVEWLNNNR